MAITGISALSGQQIIASGACSARSAATASYTTGGNDIQGLYTTVNSNSGNWNTPLFPDNITADSLYIENNGDITLLQKTGDDSDDFAQMTIRGSGIEFINGQTDPTVVGTIAGNDISNWNSTYNTVSNNSAAWTGGGGVITATGTAFRQNGTAQEAFTGIIGVAGMPIIATTLQAAAVQDIGGAKFFYGPSAKPFSTGTGGIYAPLQYATGACLAMSAGASQQNNRAYYKANEWFVSDSGQRNGAVRAEVHNTRGTHISGALPNNDGFDLLTSGLKFFSGSTTSVVDPASIGKWNSAYDQLGNVTALLDSL